MTKRCLITGAATGIGKGAALELARRGHPVTAGVQIGPQKTALAAEAESEGVELDIIVLDITDDGDRRAALSREIDVLVNNAAVMETGPIAEIPLDLVRRNFETNVFGALAVTQGFARQMVERGSGKIVFVSSMGGLVTVPLGVSYTASKHALESIAAGLKGELAGTGVEVCVLNPGPFGTGFNERGFETMRRWFDPDTTLSRPEVFAGLEGVLDGQLDPQIMVDALVEVVEEDASKFRNVVPSALEGWIRAMQEKAWEVGRDDPLWVDPAEG